MDSGYTTKDLLDRKELINRVHTEDIATITADGVSIILRHGTEDESFSMTLIDANTKEWMLDTKNIHINDLDLCLNEAIKNGKDFEALQDTQLSNYIQYTNDHYYDIDKSKEIE